MLGVICINEISYLHTDEKNDDDNKKMESLKIPSFLPEKQEIVDNLWNSLQKIKQLYSEQVVEITVNSDDTVQHIKQRLLEKIQSSDKKWKFIHKNVELSLNTRFKEIDPEIKPVILFGFCDDHQIIDLNDLKLQITKLLSQLDEDQRNRMFDHFEKNFIAFSSELSFLLQVMGCYDNKQNFYIMYDILKIFLAHGLYREMKTVKTLWIRFCKVFYPTYLHLYFELISIITSDNIRIFEIVSTQSGYKPQWVNNAIKDWLITPNIIMYLLRNGHKMLKQFEGNSTLLLQYLSESTYIAKKLNFYLFAVYKLYHIVKNEYFETLKLYIYSQQSIQIIVDYVMDRNDSNELIEYMSNINNEYIQSGLKYINHKRWQLMIETLIRDNINNNNNVSEEFESMTILVKKLSNTRMTIENIYPLTTIYEIKEKICKDKEQIEPKMQRLISSELMVQLNDEKTVSYYDIINNDTLWLIERR